MAAAIVYDGVPHASNTAGSLFQGQKFWFSHSVPQRHWLIANAEANGAVIVPLEKQADVLLVDHARKNAAPGTHSYRYVELSIRHGKLEDLDDHVVGARDRASRIVGSVTTAPKGARNAFTEADDQLLWDWVKPYEEMGATGGYVIYQQLERVNGRHTYQSWRDRWLKKVQYQKRQVKQHSLREAMMDKEMTRTQEVSTRRGDGVGGDSRQERPRAAATMSPSQPIGDRNEPRTPQRTPKALESTTGAKESVILSPETEQVRSAFSRRAQTPHTPTRANVGSRKIETPVGQGSSTAIQQQSPPATQLQSPVRMAPGGDGTFTMKEAKMLLKAAEYILITPAGEELDSCWEEMAKEYTSHTLAEWKNFFYNEIVPARERKLARQRQRQRGQVAEKPFKGVEDDGGESQDQVQQNIPKEMEKVVEEDIAEVAVQRESQDQVQQNIPEEMEKVVEEDIAEVAVHRESQDQVQQNIPEEMEEVVEEDIAEVAVQTEEKVSKQKDAACSESYVDRRTSPIREPEDTPAQKRTQRTKSLLFPPQSPTITRLPGPNEERMHSPDKNLKSNFQESGVPSQNVDVAEDLQIEVEIQHTEESTIARLRSSPFKRKRSDEEHDRERSSQLLPSVEDIIGPRQKRLRGLLEMDSGVENMEIPSTPPKEARKSESPLFVPQSRENSESGSEGDANAFEGDLVIEDEEEGLKTDLFTEESSDPELPLASEKIRGSDRSPRYHTRKAKYEERLESKREQFEKAKTSSNQMQEEESGSGPISEDEEDIYVEESVQTIEEEDERTSPLSVKLVSDREALLSPPFSQSHSKASDGSDDEDDEAPEFETAPDMSHVWETAPETIDVAATQVQGRIETLNLSEQTAGVGQGDEADIGLDEFALPEPDGGWVDVNEELEEGEEREQEIPEMYQEPINGGEKDETINAPLTLPTAAEIDAYVDAQLAAHPDLDEEFLLMAVDATCMEPTLIPTVYESISVGKGIPDDIRGVWTEDDDEGLEGGDPAGVRRVEEKHGRMWVERRWDWREGGGR
jgi:TRF2-interacting telomeric protein/Rap1 - C terminal domain/Rap1 Myb domain